MTLYYRLVFGPGELRDIVFYGLCTLHYRGKVRRWYPVLFVAYYLDLLES